MHRKHVLIQKYCQLVISELPTTRPTTMTYCMGIIKFMGMIGSRFRALGSVALQRVSVFDSYSFANKISKYFVFLCFDMPNERMTYILISYLYNMPTKGLEGIQLLCNLILGVRLNINLCLRL